MSVRPITPEDVAKLKQQITPDFVLEAFNEMIAQKWDGREAVVHQDDVVKLIRAKMANNAAVLDPEVRHENKIYDNNWLDVEPIYRAAGWAVEYDKPAYCETYRAFFTFKRKRS